MDLEDIKSFMEETLNAHAAESRESLSEHGRLINGAIQDAKDNRQALNDTLQLMQTMREESIERTATLTSDINHMSSLVTEVRNDVKELSTKATQHNVRLGIVEEALSYSSDSTTTNNVDPKSWMSTKITPTILSFTLLCFVIGMFGIAGLNVVAMATELVGP